MRDRRFFAHFILIVLVFAAGAAAAGDCFIQGVSTAEPNPDDPMLGAWRYTITITWDTGTDYGVSHIDLLLDTPGNCLCEELEEGIAWVAPTGYFTNDEEVCEVDLNAMLECGGDPSLDLVEPMLAASSYHEKYLLARDWFDEWGFVAIFIAGFSPIPYKVFTITAGVISMAFLPFVLASFVGRGARFYLVAMLMRWGGEAMEEKLKHWVDLLGWLTVLIVLIIVVVYKF